MSQIKPTPDVLILDDVLDLLNKTVVDTDAAVRSIGQFLDGQPVEGIEAICPEPREVERAFNDSEVDSLEEENYGYTLALIYLLMTVQKEIGTTNEDTERLFAKRFTEANEEFNGSPDREMALSLLSRSIPEKDEKVGEHTQEYLNHLESLGFNSRHNAMNSNAIDELLERFETITSAIESYFNDRYPQITDIFNIKRSEIEDTQNIMLEPQDVFELFDAALNTLKAEDDRWDEWRIVIVEGKALLVASCKSKAIKIGANRRPMSIDEAEGLFRHEVLIHALRSVNGKELGDDFEYGLVGYLFTEEGLGVLVEYAKNGIGALSKHFDRYTDIALALGYFTDNPIPKSELTKLTMAREASRCEIEGKDFDDEARIAAEKKIKPHVDRIYRGTVGEDAVGVFTKDIAYFGGFIKIAEHISDRLEKGESINDIMNDILSSKHDPTNSVHVAARNKRKNK